MPNIRWLLALVTRLLHPLDGTVAGTDGSVEESDLATGATPSGTDETATGSFVISAR